MTEETIVAEVTPPGRGGVSIVRLSGPASKEISRKIVKKNLTPRVATYSTFYDPQNVPIDMGIAIFFPAPHSFTGEDVVEFQGHGGRIVVQSVIETILNYGARLAKPGEFSEKAFLNDKIDLSQAEAIADLIDSHSKQAAKLALASLQGEFSKKINTLVEELIRLRTFVEAAIDFPEEDIEIVEKENILGKVKKVREEIEHILKQATSGSILREGISIVITGKPNVGKSSLLNQLAQKEAAIVTSIPGTTRDVMREYISIEGIPIHIIDTAGIRESDDVVEKEGIKRALAEIEKADFILYLSEDNHPFSNEPENISLQKRPYLVIRNKIDLLSLKPKIESKSTHDEIYLSAKTGEGVDLLRDYLKKRVGYDSEETIFIARKRHIVALQEAAIVLNKAVEFFFQHKAIELLAEDLYLAQKHLSEITGKFTNDDLLTKIFSTFCIGK